MIPMHENGVSEKGSVATCLLVRHSLRRWVRGLRAPLQNWAPGGDPG